MGKKKISKQTEAEAIQESEKVAETTARKSAGGTAKKVEEGRVYIHATFNNTIITVTDQKGGVIAWMSAGSLGFSGPKKATPFAASKVAEALAEKVKKSGPVSITIYVRGIGKGRDAAVRALAGKFNIIAVKDITPIPHNGPRPRKVRRV